ncbi:hypothetical protein V1514DRAFT_327082 [Lipomyces japonicus]|uniref:uncharacterized protein n=1 Tax=Lipomyces japonicus TaxID=56871 RepID=UPI0034CF2875
MMPAPIDISYQRPQQHSHRFRRESVAHSQGMGGISWGAISVGSWFGLHFSGRFIFYRALRIR